jgi:hypothetical protein
MGFAFGLMENVRDAVSAGIAGKPLVSSRSVSLADL